MSYKKNLEFYDLLMSINLDGWRLFFKDCVELINQNLHSENVKYGKAIIICLHNRDLIGANRWFNKYKKHQIKIMEQFEDTEGYFEFYWRINEATKSVKLTENNEDRYLKICDFMKRDYELFERYIEILEYKLKNHHF